MIPLAQSGAPWREPRSVAMSARRVVLAETEPGVWKPMAAAEALAFGGAAAVLEETAPGTETYRPIAIDGMAADASRLEAVRIGDRITLF